MTPAPPSRPSRPSAATLILVAAALIALVSAGIAVSRSAGKSAAASSEGGPAAQDWRDVGWAYVEANRADKAAAAYRRAAAIEPGNAENWASLGEVLQAASRTVVPEAQAAFRKALELDPRDPRARYFLAVQKDLAGDPRGAVDGWLALLKDTPPGAPWEADLRRAIEESAAKHRIDLAGRMPAPGATGAPAAVTATAAIPGPSPEQLAAASSIPPGEQDAMIAQMMARLEARLKADPRNEEGWIRLMRSRMVLGETGKAAAALRSGLAAFKGDEAVEGRLRNAAAELGVPRAG